MDVVIAGGGLGGLTAGALLAKAGREVLLLEQHSKVGGAATIFGRKQIKVEVGLHELDGMDNPGDPKRTLFASLGLSLDVVRIPELYAVHSPLLGEPFVMPDGLDPARAAVLDRFPQARRGVEDWFNTLDRLYAAIQSLSALQDLRGWRAGATALRLAPQLAQLARHERTPLSWLLDRCAGDTPGLDLVLAANLGYYHHDTGASLLYFAAAQGSYLHGGGHYIRGGSQALSDALAEVIRAGGGEVLTGAEVTGVLVEDGRAAGVRYLRQGQEVEVRARAVIGNAAPAALAELLPPDRREAFRAPWGAMRPGTSAWSVYLGFDEPPAAPAHYSSFYYPDWMSGLAAHGESRALMGADPMGRLPSYVAVNYARIDHGLPFRGLHLVVLTGLDLLAPWEALSQEAYQERKRRWLAALVEDFLRRNPSLRPHLVYQELGTARTMRRYLRTPAGAIYGFEQSPDQIGRFRPGARTALPGLYLSSAWASPGGGFTGAMMAGISAARAVTDEPKGQGPQGRR
ncbi:MAG: NAD(P)/FAD-dependent oxidoreductase [Deltaproteobacteria bacterium]|nr:NAD(P)/FAD-dependent oxidoreductase [Deltaproteobacteria bacterium]